MILRFSDNGNEGYANETQPSNYLFPFCHRHRLFRFHQQKV